MDRCPLMMVSYRAPHASSIVARLLGSPVMAIALVRL
jgi:hypothetical protein